MKILVIGASGKTGQKLLEHLSKVKHDVTGLIRTQEQENLVKQFNAKPLLGNLEDDIATLADGFDAIMFVAGSRGKNVQGVDYQGLAKIIDAAINAKIKRFLYIGSINTGKKPEQYIEELKAYYRQINEVVPEGLLTNTQKKGYQTYVEMKTLAEEKIIASGINYTILRAGLLTQEPGSGKVNVTEGTLNAFGKISRDNVAQCFIEALENKNTYKKIYTILDGEIIIKNAFLPKE